MLQQRLTQSTIILHDVGIAPAVSSLSASQPNSLQATKPHAFNTRRDPIAVLLASHPQQAADLARPRSAGFPSADAHTTILTSLVLQRQGIEVQASSQVAGQAWNLSAEAGAANPQEQLQAAPGIGADPVLIWQRQGPAVLWSLGAGKLLVQPHDRLNQMRQHKALFGNPITRSRLAVLSQLRPMLAWGEVAMLGAVHVVKCALLNMLQAWNLQPEKQDAGSDVAKAPGAKILCAAFPNITQTETAEMHL